MFYHQDNDPWREQAEADCPECNPEAAGHPCNAHRLDSPEEYDESPLEADEEVPF